MGSVDVLGLVKRWVQPFRRRLALSLQSAMPRFDALDRTTAGLSLELRNVEAAIGRLAGQHEATWGQVQDIDTRAAHDRALIAALRDETDGFARAWLRQRTELRRLRPPAPPGKHRPATILVDCTDSALDPGNPGIVRTTRLLGRALLAGGAVRPVFAAWDRQLRTYRALTPPERDRLASYGGPAVDDAPLDPAPLLLLGEAPVDGQIAQRLLWADARGMAVAAILYDLIPISHPSLCVPGIVRRFPDYLEAVCGADALFAISADSLRRLETYAETHALPLPPERRVIPLPAQLGALPRETAPPPPGPIRCLSVGSIEPRKNQANLVAAFDRLRRRRPDLPLELTLVGNRFAGAEALAARIEALAAETGAFRWLGIVDDGRLAALYREAAFTAYPSLVEGFGLPIAESLWMGRPCLCHAGGVMAEHAAGGGCLTVDMTDIGAIEAALERLASDTDLRARLGREAATRPLTAWPAYAAAIAEALPQPG